MSATPTSTCSASTCRTTSAGCSERHSTCSRGCGAASARARAPPRHRSCKGRHRRQRAGVQGGKQARSRGAARLRAAAPARRAPAAPGRRPWAARPGRAVEQRHAELRLRARRCCATGWAASGAVPPPRGRSCHAAPEPLRAGSDRSSIVMRRAYHRAAHPALDNRPRLVEHSGAVRAACPVSEGAHANEIDIRHARPVAGRRRAGPGPGQRGAGADGQEAEHPDHLGRRHRPVQHQRQQPRHDGLQDAQHRPHRQARARCSPTGTASRAAPRGAPRSSPGSRRSAPG